MRYEAELERVFMEGFAESKKTAALSSTHAPIGHGGRNWFTRLVPGNKGQMPAYIQNIRNALIKHGHDKGSATAIAIGTVRRWARGGGNVHPEVRSAARKALAEFDKMRAQSKSMTASRRVARESARESAFEAAIAVAEDVLAEWTPGS